MFATGRKSGGGVMTTITHTSEDLEEIFKDVSKILFQYVWWVLYESVQKKFKTIYFLARDGYPLLEIALLICEKFNLNIQCKYFYCSRYSLRMASYHIIGDEKFDLICSGSYHMTLNVLFQRLGMSTEEGISLMGNDFSELGLNCDTILSKSQLSAFREIITKNEQINLNLETKSKITYQNFLSYLIQEEMMLQEQVVLVDSGWTGSMQRSLRQILQYSGYDGKLNGFYFGMFSDPKSFEDGEYYTFYFSKESSIMRKILFNNNLLECFLSATHGMTIDYFVDCGVVKPILLPSPETQMRSLVYEQLEIYRNYTKKQINQLDFNSYSKIYMEKKLEKIIKRIMVHPNKNETDVFRKYSFCDDMTDSYKNNLISETSQKVLNEYLIHRKLYKKLKKEQQQLIFWQYGEIARLPRYKQGWYRLHVYLWDGLRFLFLE